MRLFNRYFSGYHLILPLLDLLLALLIAGVGRLLVDIADSHLDGQWATYLLQGGAVGVLIVLVFYFADLYSIDSTMPRREWSVRLLTAFAIACLILASVSHVIPRPTFRDISLTTMLLIGVGIMSWHLIFAHALKRRKVFGKILIVGTETIGKALAEELYRWKNLGMEVIGFVAPMPGTLMLSYGNPKRVTLPIYPRHSTIQVVEAAQVNRILVGSPESCADFPAQDLVMLRMRGIPIEECHRFYERVLGKIPVVDLQPGWLVLSDGFRLNRWIFSMKRAVDVVVSIVGLILASPIALLAALAIKLESEGPVIYCQERVGHNEEPFKLYKFRSMKNDAENGTGPVWASTCDARVTLVGRILRKLRIDEIPQMINVLRGEMSFVGPRPERPFFVSQLKENIHYYHLRFAVKPGITGWAQICYPYGDSQDDAVEKLHYDLYYIKNISPLFDLQIIFETLKTVLLRRGAR